MSESDLPRPRDGVSACPSVGEVLNSLRSPVPGGITASDGDLFSGALFGRDAAEVGEDCVHFDDELPANIIRALIRYQGQRNMSRGFGSNEEEFGKIHHECRVLDTDPRLPDSPDRAFAEMWERWGGVGNTLIYYGSVDATILFARLVSEYCQTWGQGILSESVVTYTGLPVTVEMALLRAVGWILKKKEQSPIGLIEFNKRNPHGISHQGWKDSGTAYLHEDGRQANSREPIASVEIQALAVDALRGAARLLGEKYPDAAREWESAAASLQERVFSWFWMPDMRYFAQGIDRDPAGVPRLIRTLSSNGAILLDTTIFDDLPSGGREHYVEPVVARILGDEFLTDAGIRCRSLRYADLVPFFDYHGSCAVWPKESYDIACGLRRQGYARLADQLEIRILNTINISGQAKEFYYVDGEGTVAYRVVRTGANAKRRSEFRNVVVGTNVPERDQAWSASAALAIKHNRALSARREDGILSPFERGMLDAMPLVEVVTSQDECHELQDSVELTGVNTVLGKYLSGKVNAHRESTPPTEVEEYSN